MPFGNIVTKSYTTPTLNITAECFSNYIKKSYTSTTVALKTSPLASADVSFSP